ncbi:MAG: flagellar filament capping protein FliD [Actinobacteria bacterium]|nr:flagellar filament capping protein FliD [Actinomycetota bacterium]
MALATSGIYSGLDVESMIKGLMQVERQPLVRLQKKEAGYQAKISGLGTMLSALSGFKSSMTAIKGSSLISMKAVSQDSNVFTASATTDAVAALHNIKVNNIASVQSIYSAAFTSETAAVADLTTHAVQKLKIQVGAADPVTITIDANNNTLAGVRNAVNSANAGVKASILNDGTGHRLILTSTTTGASNRISVLVDEDNNGVFGEAAETDLIGLSRLAFNPTSYDAAGNPTAGVMNMTQSQAARDASLTVNGLAVTNSSNTITNVISGVTLSLKKDSAGGTLALDVSMDRDALKAKMTALTGAYNNLMGTVKDLRGGSTGKGLLRTDNVVNTVYSELRGLTSNAYSGLTLADIGVSVDKYGVMSFDAAKFDSKLSASTADVTKMLNTMGTSLESKLDSYIKTAIPDKQDGYRATIKVITKRGSDMELRLSKTEKMLRKKFENLDRQLAQLQGQGNYLTQLQTQIKSIGGSK